MLKRNQYPKQLLLGDAVYRIKFVRAFEDKTQLGECDPETLEIKIKCGQSREETLKTFIHETLHALLDFEHGVKIKHKLIYKLEEPIYQLIRDNFFT